MVFINIDRAAFVVVLSKCDNLLDMIYCICKERVKREIQQIIAGRKVVCIHVSRQRRQGHLYVAFCDWFGR